MNSQERAAAEERILAHYAAIASGDPKFIHVAKRAFDALPDEMIALYGGDPAARVIAGLIDRLAGTDLFRREAVARRLAQVRADFEGENPSPAVRLLAERAAVCWLVAYEADLTCEDAAGGADERVLEYYERRRDRAHRRLLSAVKALEVVRRIAAPAKRPEVGFGGRLAGVAGAGRN